MEEEELKLNIGAMGSEDLPHVLAIEATSFSLPWTREMFEGELGLRAISRNLVAKVPCSPSGQGTSPELEVAGYICTWLLEQELHINNLAVASGFRRKGVGRQLLRAALEMARREGVRSAVLEVRASNLAAQRLYQSFGFRVAGVRRNYYSRPREDALIMRLDFS